MQTLTNKQQNQYSFPKTQRFQESSEINQPILYLPTYKNMKSSSIGLGKKFMYHQFHFPRATANPSPNQYYVNIQKKTQFGVDYSRSGESFNKISFQKQLSEKPLKRFASQVEFQKFAGQTTQKLSHQLCFQQTEKTPGPGQYYTERKIGDDRNKISISRQLSQFNESQLKPGPNKYKPNYNFIKKNAPENTFGYGRKLLIQEISNSIKEQYNPGPGMYETNTGIKSKSKNVKLNPPQYIKKV